MAYTESEAKQLVVDAGKKLIETGLIARTWGNVSARISDTQFVITPSGRAYETLTPDDIVTVNIADCSYNGDIKPSSEKGIHADAYRLRPEANFVIHTHQVKASAVGATGLPIENVPEKYAKIIGDFIPVASYGMPSTGKLRSGVEAAYMAYPNSKAILMVHHGAVCTGKDCEEAFDVISALEELCSERIEMMFKLYEGTPEYSHKAMLNSFIKAEGGGKLPEYVSDLGCSIRNGSQFIVTYKNGANFCINLSTGKSDLEEKLPASVIIHRAIYRSDSSIKYIRHLTDSDIIAYSMSGKAINPRLDDFSQIAGTKVACAKWDGSAKSASSFAKALTGKNAVLVKGSGAICTGTCASDLDAVELVMSKECLTNICAVIFGSGDTLSPIDCALMRTIYVTKYSKKAKE